MPDVRTYFRNAGPRIPNVTIRAENALMRGGVRTMEQLCEMDDDEIRRIRKIGEKCFEFAVAMRAKYMEEIERN